MPEQLQTTGQKHVREGAVMMIEPCPNLWVESLLIESGGRTYSASLSACGSPFLSSYLETVKFLHANERAYLDALTHERRVQSFLAGRFAAKGAAAALIGETDWSRILIEPGIFQQPVLRHPHARNLLVSITHSDEFGAAVACPEELPMGVDLERAGAVAPETLAAQMTDRELELLCELPHDADIRLAILWTAKEALSKILKTGLTTSFRIYEIKQVEIAGDAVRSRFVHFPQYVTESHVWGDRVFSVTYPQRAKLNSEGIRRVLRSLEHAGCR